MNLRRIIKYIYLKLMKWIKKQKPSFLAYLFAFVLLVFSINHTIIYIASMLLFAFALLYDISLFLKMSHGKYWEKFIYLSFSILAYFSYIHAEALAKLSIYTETGIKVEYFETALAYFKGIYFVPSIIIIAIILVACTLLFLIFLSVIPMYVNFILKDKKIVKIIRHQYIHILLFLISSIIVVTMSLTHHQKFYESFFNENFIASGILKYEFVPNRSCSNIPKGTLIKLLDGDNVLVSNIKQLPLLSISEDENATFILNKCTH